MEKTITIKDNLVTISDEKIAVGDKICITLEHDLPSIETVNRIDGDLIYTIESRNNWIKRYHFIDIPYGVFKIKRIENDN